MSCCFRGGPAPRRRPGRRGSRGSNTSAGAERRRSVSSSRPGMRCGRSGRRPVLRGVSSIPTRSCSPSRCGRAGGEARCLPIEPDDPERIAAVVRDAAAECDLLIVIAGVERGPGRLHGTGGRVRRDPGRARGGRAAGGTRSCSASSGRTPRARRARLPGVGGTHVRHLRGPAAGGAHRCAAAAAAACFGPAGAQARVTARHGRLDPGPPRIRRRDPGWRPRCRAVPGY